jgi:SAM-dependent methyltransferase
VDGAFDAAVTVTVVHHVPPAQWSAFLGEMSRVVRPGGVVAVFEHNPYNPLTLCVVRTCPLDRNAVLLSSWRLCGLLRAIGLQDVQSRYILSTPFEWRLFRLFDKAIGWLPLGAQYYATGRVRQPPPFRNEPA